MARATDDLRRDPAVRVGDYAVTPVCRVRIQAHRVGHSIVFFGSKTPTEVVVRMGEEEWTIPVPESGDGAGD